LVSPPTSLSLASKNDLRYMLKKKKKPITALSALHGQDISEEFLKNEKVDGIRLKEKSIVKRTCCQMWQQQRVFFALERRVPARTGLWGN